MSRFRFAPAVCALLLAAAPARAELIFESGDAGSFPSSAQVIKSTDPLHIVRGMLSHLNDVDVFQFTQPSGWLTAGTPSGSEFGFAQGPTLHLFNGAGKHLSSGFSIIGMKLPADTYYLAITSRFNAPNGDPLSPSTGWKGSSGGGVRDYGEYRIVVARDLPEPGSLTLLALGAAGLAGYARWRRSATPAAA
ncbi:MAG: PEP-CTERM sorting domain-containing protein [Gemmataceae bacterium]|nr:PEP-CTERM sorting domain-containing protein [Gemmataceae bacterium]